MHVFTYVFVMLSILQSQFIEKGFKKAKNFEQNVVLLLFSFTLDRQPSFSDKLQYEMSEVLKSSTLNWLILSFWWMMIKKGLQN